MAVVLRRTKRGHIDVEAQGNMLWVSAIRKFVPPSSRSYERPVWTFNPRYYHCVLTITKHYFSNIIDQVGTVSEPQANEWKRGWAEWLEVDELEGVREPVGVVRHQSTPHARLHLTSDAPPEVVDAAYRALAKIHHPDRGGNQELMKAINVAYDQIKNVGNR